MGCLALRHAHWPSHAHTRMLTPTPFVTHGRMRRLRLRGRQRAEVRGRLASNHGAHLQPLATFSQWPTITHRGRGANCRFRSCTPSTHVGLSLVADRRSRASPYATMCGGPSLDDLSRPPPHISRLHARAYRRSRPRRPMADMEQETNDGPEEQGAKQLAIDVLTVEGMADTLLQAVMTSTDKDTFIAATEAFLVRGMPVETEGARKRWDAAAQRFFGVEERVVRSGVRFFLYDCASRTTRTSTWCGQLLVTMQEELERKRQLGLTITSRDSILRIFSGERCITLFDALMPF